MLLEWTHLEDLGQDASTLEEDESTLSTSNALSSV